MNTRIVQLARYLSLYTCLLLVASSAANAQQDTVEFKFIPKYYPEQLRIHRSAAARLQAGHCFPERPEPARERSKGVGKGVGEYQGDRSRCTNHQIDRRCV